MIRSSSLLALSASLAAGVATFAAADPGKATLAIEVPRLQVAEYHRPYVAAWLTEAGSGDITNLAVWYQLDVEGEEWLKDMRQWWRRTGRGLDVPVDGVTGATRPPGNHPADVAAHFDDLEPGSYTLLIEAAREVGGRELLELSFEWPVAEPLRLQAQGESELGAVVLELRP